MGPFYRKQNITGTVQEFAKTYILQLVCEIYVLVTTYREVVSAKNLVYDWATDQRILNYNLVCPVLRQGIFSQRTSIVYYCKNTRLETYKRPGFMG